MACLFFQMKNRLVNIAIPNMPPRLFTYSLPEGWTISLRPGQRCLVPLGRRRVAGYYVESTGIEPKARLKPIIDVIDHETLFNSELWKFLQWMSEYYFANPGDVLNASLPPDLRKIRKPHYRVTDIFEQVAGESGLEAGWRRRLGAKGILGAGDIKAMEAGWPGLLDRLVTTGALKADWSGIAGIKGEIILGYKLAPLDGEGNKDYDRLASLAPEADLLSREAILESGVSQYRFRKMVEQNTLMPVYGLPGLFDYFRPRPEINTITPNNEQAEAIKKIMACMGRFEPFLLYGITGSGKTLVYCHLAREVLERGGTVLVLVPEIALAGTLLTYFKAFFGDSVALLHSALKSRERVLVWQNIRNGHFRIVIGARSAIFSPMENLGMIVVDEEHDESYKQDDPSPRFQARDAAVMRAKMAGIPIILGSASPSVESFYNAESGRYRLLKLTRRPEQAAVPLVRVVDLKKERYSTGDLFFTPILKDKIRRSLDEKNQIILYLNRRGFSPRIKCLDCGFTPECPHCNISLTYHRSGNRLVCHFCGFINSNYNKCASCGGDNFLHLGTGTQKIEDKLGELFPEAAIVRLDSDSAAGRDRVHVILSEFASRKHDILLGTQMVTKGIDFPDVSLVGVLMADIGLDMPDFRASEKLFAKLIQVSGRSGRGIIPGEVVIQTFNPETDLIDDAARQDYDSFYAREILSRKQLQYPPFAHLINFRLSSKNEKSLEKSALDFRQRLEMKVKENDLSGQILGPAPSPLYRLRGMYRRHLFLKTRQILKAIRIIGEWEYHESNFGLISSARPVVDIDPYDMM
nr:primosomal protein N' [candidate division Zixibacteria bacterium]